MDEFTHLVIAILDNTLTRSFEPASKTSNARPYINEGAIYELRGDNESAIANYLVAAKLFASHNYHQEANEFASRVLNLDSTNVEAKEILGIE